MKPAEFVRFLNRIERLKCETRHSWTSTGRQESVAEHSWRLSVMALLCRDEYPALDIEKVIKMCLIHDLGEAITGDIPAFLKQREDEAAEDIAIAAILKDLPQTLSEDLTSLFNEMRAMQTDEAKLFKALDNLEALISHNEAPLETWLENEYTDNLTYGQENVMWSEWTKELKDVNKAESLRKIKTEKR